MKIRLILISVISIITTILSNGGSQSLELIWIEKDSIFIDSVYSDCLNMEEIEFCNDSFSLRTWTLFISNESIDADGQKPSRIILGKAFLRNDTLILIGEEKKSIHGLIINGKKPKIEFHLKRLFNTSNNQDIWIGTESGRIFLNKKYIEKSKKLY
jgi:hypothetical protein